MSGPVSSLSKQCLACGLCIDKCPALSLITHGADGSTLISDILDVLEGGPSTASAKEIIWTCMACGQCRQWCPEEIAPDIFAAARRELLRRGSAPFEKLMLWLPDSPYRLSSLIGAITFTDNPPPWQSQPAHDGTAFDVAVYIGCYAQAVPAIVMTLTDLIKKMGFSVVTVGGDGLCCGAGYALNGKYNAAQMAAQRSVEVIRSFKPKIVVFECASCFGALSQRLHSTSQCYLHTDFLLNNLNLLKLQNLPQCTVTYHDTCDPRRAGIGDYKTPRQLLKSLPGIKLVEMERQGKNSLCCGGLANTTNPEITRKLRIGRLKEAAATGAKMMVTSCRSCYGAFVGLDREYIKTTHDILLLGEYAGVYHPELFRELLQCNNLPRVFTNAGSYYAAHGLDANTAVNHLTRFLHGNRP